jgi:hypothetical protein
MKENVCFVGRRTQGGIIEWGLYIQRTYVCCSSSRTLESGHTYQIMVPAVYTVIKHHHSPVVGSIVVSMSRWHVDYMRAIQGGVVVSVAVIMSHPVVCIIAIYYID